MKAVEEKPATSNTKRLLGKVALVTGGSRGIGAAIARRLAEEGATVAITYAKSKQGAESVVADITKLGSVALAYKADATSVVDAQNLVKELEQSVGRIDILINNAGVLEGGPIDQVDVEQYQRVFDVNVKGVIATTNAALKLIPEGGRIINLSSIAAKSSLPGLSIYSASKAALDALTRIWAQELGSKGITVNGVAPGATVTDMYDQALSADAKEDVIAKTALGRAGQPADIASVVVFLASNDGGWITGQTIVTDGGFNG